MIRSALAESLRRAWAVVALLAACLALGAPSSALASDDTGAPSNQSRETMFHAVAWRLTLANAPYCANSWPSIGLKLAERDGKMSVLSVAPGSPAEKAGLRPGQQLLDIEGLSSDQPAHRQIEIFLDENGVVAITWKDESGIRRNATIAAELVCPSRFLTRKGKKIGADGVNVRFGLKFPGFE